MKPKIINELYTSDDNLMGIISGLIIRNEKTNYMDYYINNLNILINGKETNLIIENLDGFSQDELDLIENKTNTRIVTGKNIKLLFIPYIIEEISKHLINKTSDMDILLLSDDLDEGVDFISKLPIEIKNLYLYNKDINKAEEIAGQVFHKIGLSLILKKNLKNLNHSIIINLGKNNILHKDGLRRNTIIFDLRDGHSSNLYHKDIENIIYDFLFYPRSFTFTNKLGLTFPIDSSLYESLELKAFSDFWGFKTKAGKIEFYKYLRRTRFKASL